MFGGGWAGIILVCMCLILYYTFITMFFLSKVNEFHKWNNIDQANLCVAYLFTKLSLIPYENDFIYDLLITIGVSLLIYPFCLLKEFHRIRVNFDLDLII